MATFIYKINAVRPGFANGPTEAEVQAMSQHFAYLKKLLAEGKLFLAGPCLDTAFGIVIFDVDSLEEAEQIAFNDPSVLQGVMNVELHPFKISLLRDQA